MAGISHEIGDLHRLLVDRVQEYAIFAIDPQGYILTWNQGAERLKGYTRGEAIGKHFSIFYPPVDFAAGKPARELGAAVALGLIEDEGWRMRKDGSRFWASVLITALKDDRGELIGFAKVTRDLTDRRAGEDAIRKREEQFRLLVESVTDYAIFMLDPDGIITTWNAGAQRIKGYAAHEIIGEHFSIFYPQEDLDVSKPQRELILAGSEGEYEDEGWRVRKDGSRFWANVVITPIHGANGALVGFAKVTRDLTERRTGNEQAREDARLIAARDAEGAAAEERSHELTALAERLRVQADELERRRAEADSANRIKTEFLAAMSHELRTPLNAISGYTQLMQMGLSGPVTEKQQHQLERIQRSQAHLLGIINDILNFSRIEAGHIAYDIGPVPARDVMDAVASMIAPQALAKGLTLKVELCLVALVIEADHAKVEQILLNLLSNAVKFTHKNGEIVLTCGIDLEQVWFRVCDTGTGIPAEQLETIFAPFVQLGRTLANPKEGTGLGLAISRDLAHAMHGDITVASHEGVGSTFTLTLPRAPLS